MVTPTTELEEVETPEEISSVTAALALPEQLLLGLTHEGAEPSCDTPFGKSSDAILPSISSTGFIWVMQASTANN